MGQPLHVYVGGKPRSQPRGRPHVHCALASKRRGMKCPSTIVSTMNDTVKAYRSMVMQACRDAAKSTTGAALLASDQAISFTLVLWFGTKVETRWGTPHMSVPDLDNVTKLFQDVVVDVGLLPRGDGRVAHLSAIKAWAKDDGALVKINPIDVGYFSRMMELLSGTDQVRP